MGARCSSRRATTLPPPSTPWWGCYDLAILSPVVRHRSTATGPYITSITPEAAGWSYSGLRVLELPPGGQLELGTGPDEVIVLPLSGSATVKCGRQRVHAARPARASSTGSPTSPTCPAMRRP